MWNKHTLHRVVETRRCRKTTWPLANLVENFMRRKVIPRQKKLARLGQAWQDLLPEELLEHTCLENLRHGTLRVLVDNASSVFELNQMKEELLRQLQYLCPRVAPAEIRFVRGFWYHMNEEGIRMPDYESVKLKESKINGDG